MIKIDSKSKSLKEFKDIRFTNLKNRDQKKTVLKSKNEPDFIKKSGSFFFGDFNQLKNFMF
jgi:hypothetical protein